MSEPLFEIEPEPEPTVTFVGHCARCGAVTAVIPDVSHEQYPAWPLLTWHAAEAFAYVEQKRHERDACPARSSATPGGSSHPRQID